MCLVSNPTDCNIAEIRFVRDSSRAPAFLLLGITWGRLIFDERVSVHRAVRVEQDRAVVPTFRKGSEGGGDRIHPEKARKSG